MDARMTTSSELLSRVYGATDFSLFLQCYRGGAGSTESPPRSSVRKVRVGQRRRSVLLLVAPGRRPDVGGIDLVLRIVDKSPPLLLGHLEPLRNDLRG